MSKEVYRMSLYAMALRASTDERALTRRNEEPQAKTTRKREKDT